MCFIELDVSRDITFTIGDRLSFGNNKIKKAVLHLSEEAPVSNPRLRRFKHQLYEYEVITVNISTAS